MGAPEQEKRMVLISGTDEERVRELAKIHNELLEEGSSGVLKLMATLEASTRLIGAVDEAKKELPEDAEWPIVIEVDEDQQRALELARGLFVNKKPEQGIGAIALS